jgi:hypothetical protein
MKAVLPAVLVMLLAVLVPLGRSENRANEKPTEFGAGVQAGFALTKYHDTCIQFRVYFIAKDFFRSLKRAEEGGAVFKKGHDSFQKFPELTTVDVEATAFPCAGEQRPLPPEFAGGLLANPDFQLSWKTANGLLSVVPLSIRTRHQALSLRWDYYLNVPTRDVDLTTQMIIDCSLRKDADRVRVTAQLP